jgi:hypothetical protein
MKELQGADLQLARFLCPAVVQRERLKIVDLQFAERIRWS